MLLIDSNGLDSILNTISTHSREIDALIRMAGGTLYKFEKAEGEAHTVDVPTGAKMGDILSIGGKSFVLNNLWNNTLTKSNSSTWASAGGITYVANGRKIIGTFNEAKTISNYTYNTYFGNNSISVTFKKNHTYYVAIDYTTSFAYTNDYIYLYTTATNTLGRGNDGKYRQIYTYTGDDSAMSSFRFYNKGASASIVAGDTITIEVKYLVDLTQAGLDDLTLDECNALFDGQDIPYNTGELFSVKSDRVVSKGRNLTDKNNSINGTFWGSSLGRAYADMNSEVMKYIGKTITLSATVTVNTVNVSNAYYGFFCHNGPGAIEGRTQTTKQAGDKLRVSVTFTPQENTIVYMYSGTSTVINNATFSDWQIELGTSATTYSPYFTTTTNILPVVTQAEAKCYRINADIKDTIDYAGRKITHKVGKVDLGSLTWVKTAINGNVVFQSRLNNLNARQDVQSHNIYNALCEKYASRDSIDVYTNGTDKSIVINHGYFGNVTSMHDFIVIYDSAFTDASALKSSLSGVILYYELATPTEENLADIIPENSSWLDTYGASAGSVYNEIDFANRKYIQRVGKVDIGNLGWALSSNGQNVFYVRIADITLGVNGNQRGLCSKYLMSKVWATFDTMLDKTIYHNPTERTLIYIKDTAYTDATAFKSAMSGVYLYYELANPIETDISNYLTDELTFKVEAGGTITLENTNDKNIPVPYSLEYAIALREVARYEQN